MNYFYFDSSIEYPNNAPFFPGEIYKEYPFSDTDNMTGTNDNKVYSAIREMMEEMGLDKSNVGKPEWNPLGDFIIPGQTILLKPNMVNHFNSAEVDQGRGMDCLITHPSVVRCMFDYVYIALKGTGKIIIADAPIQGCDFDKLLKKSGYGELFEYIKSKRTQSLEIVTSDLRELLYKNINGVAKQIGNSELNFPGVMVDLGTQSYFGNIKNNKKLRITSYASDDTIMSHSEDHNFYKISSAILEADVIINLPKPKTHRIAGYTGALKNMIGANSRKEFLPHHQTGSDKTGGDEYTEKHRIIKYINSRLIDINNYSVKYKHYYMERIVGMFLRKTEGLLRKCEPDGYRYGMWYGNDTIWRTILDVNHAVLYADKDGKMRTEKKRKMISLGDMIVCGDHEGPLCPSYKKVGGFLFSDDLVEFDLILVKLMGFDYKKFPVLVNALKDNMLYKYDKSPITVLSNVKDYKMTLKDIKESFDFCPTKGWQEYLN